MIDLVHSLRSSAFVLWGVEVTWAEVLGDITGILCVWLMARKHVLTWPVGLANNVFWCLLFFDARLYADAVLQTVFFALGVYGWSKWSSSRAERVLEVRHWTQAEALCGSFATLALTLSIAWILDHQSDSPAPFADASLLAISLWATYGQTQKILETWWLWIGVDAISVPLYMSRSLYPTAAVYVVFGLLCVRGLRSWSSTLQRAQSI